MDPDCIIACGKLSFTQEEKLRYERLRTQIFNSLTAIDELENGYSFVLTHEPSLLQDLADWIPLEHECCPFLTFTLTLYESEYVRLSLTGPQEVKQFLLHELNLAS